MLPGRTRPMKQKRAEDRIIGKLNKKKRDLRELSSSHRGRQKPGKCHRTLRKIVQGVNTEYSITFTQFFSFSLDNSYSYAVYQPTTMEERQMIKIVYYFLTLINDLEQGRTE